MNFVPDTRDDTTHSDVAQVCYHRASDHFYWKGPVTGKEMSMSREDFGYLIFAPYYLWNEMHPNAPYPAGWRGQSKPHSQTLKDDAAELAEIDEATDAFNFIQDTRDAAADIKGGKEGRPIHEWPVSLSSGTTGRLTSFIGKVRSPAR